MQSLTLTQPDDFHLHLRDEAEMISVVSDSARQFARAIVMPNLDPPVRTTQDAKHYHQRILDALPQDTSFQPLMTLYLTEQTSPEEIIEAKKSGIVYAVKYYPAGVTTHAEWGVSDLAKVYPVFEAMSESGMPLLIHGEVTDPDVDIFDREGVYINRVMVDLVNRFEQLKIVLEHITTRQAVEFIKQGSDNLAATITPQHILLNRNALFENGLRPHNYCLPVLKAEQHRQAVLEAAISGHPRFFLGTDSAPHARSRKEADCGCAGIYSAHAALETYAEVFEQVNALDKLEAFASFYGADFYGLPRNSNKITLVKEPWLIPETLPLASDSVIPLRAGQQCAWKIKH